MSVSRRRFLAATGSLAGVGFLGATRCGGLAEAAASPAAAAKRRFHVSISPDGLDADPGLLDLYRSVGVDAVWVTGFLYGYWAYSVERIEKWRRAAEAKGIAAHVINVPIGHPGDALQAPKGGIPVTPPPHWKTAVGLDGQTYCGTSLHPPATPENVEAVKRLASLGVKEVFLDDDFRLARSPGMIGGCFCPEHKRAFLARGGYGEPQWNGLLDAIRGRRPTPLVNAWIEFICDQLTESFRAQQAAAPGMRIGPMIMYLGAEKAGIRLSDYRDAIVRVGEGHFNDGDFGTLKGKCNELFSVLFHRRFFRPELSYSETTAFPADRLSAKHLAAKLVISTVADVRHTMYMSGLTPFPRERWATLGPAMRREAAFHEKLAGHALRGPLKHYWGRDARTVGDDDPYSLFLAMGVPFEVTDSPAADGFTFLDAFDGAAAAEGRLKSPGTTFVLRSGTPAAGTDRRRIVPERLDALFALKREITAGLNDVPYVVEDVPAVCAWYPTARSVLVWNLSDRRETLTLRRGASQRSLTLDSLEPTVVGDGLR